MVKRKFTGFFEDSDGDDDDEEDEEEKDQSEENKSFVDEEEILQNLLGKLKMLDMKLGIGTGEEVMNTSLFIGNDLFQVSYFDFVINIFAIE